MNKWESIPISEKLFTNVAETSLTKASAALENAFINEAGGFTRFPGLEQVLMMTVPGRVYLSKWRNDLIAVVGGKVFRINQAMIAQDVTGEAVGGGRRVTFGGTEKELVMAAGGNIVFFNGDTTQLLSADAPLSTHVAYVEGYVLAAETDTSFFQHSTTNEARVWDALDIFAANVRPDNVNALVASPYGEILICGTDSVEQYERLQSGTVPFYRRWSAGEGLFAPYTLISDKDGNWGVNNRFEFVRFSGQTSQSASDDIGRSLETIDNWTDAWAVQMNLVGQKFMLLQMPFATNVYQTKGVTLIFDYRQKKWLNLYGWDSDVGQSVRWPGWSYLQIWGRHFVGGEGVLYELKNTYFRNGAQVQRILGRTAHIGRFGEVEINNVRMRVKRGVGTNEVEPVINLRCLKDNKTWTRWVRKGLGKTGDRAMNIEFGPMGMCHTFQFEWYVSDACELEIVDMQAQMMPLGD